MPAFHLQPLASSGIFVERALTLTPPKVIGKCLALTKRLATSASSPHLPDSGGTRRSVVRRERSQAGCRAMSATGRELTMRPLTLPYMSRLTQMTAPVLHRHLPSC